MGWPYKGQSRHRNYNGDKPFHWFLKFFGTVDIANFLWEIKFSRGKTAREKNEPKEHDVTLKLTKEFAGSSEVAGLFIGRTSQWSTPCRNWSICVY
jgi:hypothetical protein